MLWAQAAAPVVQAAGVNQKNVEAGFFALERPFGEPAVTSFHSVVALGDVPPPFSPGSGGRTDAWTNPPSQPSVLASA